ncbi:hypothetical protein [Mycolicibacterium pulveris]|uniref:hypothetical protein n=1 Tax=Mycolicibacterium pulveris TaxID=36813 RepID=UPI003CEDDDEA
MAMVVQMFPVMRLGMVAAALAVCFAAPAAATEDEYLSGLQARYTFLTADQLLSEGHRVCTGTSAGLLVVDAVNMVREDLDVATGAALDIVSGALRDLC